MNSLEKQEKRNQEYFQPNPNGSYDEKRDPFESFFDNSFFNDQFFKEFFDNKPLGGNFKDKNNNNKIDW